MIEEKLKDFVGDFALLIEAGFIAVKQLDEVSATRIFCAAQILNRHSTAPQIGLGYIALNKLEIKQATATFEMILQKEPENHLAQTFLAMCFLLTKSKRKKGEKMLQEILAVTTDPTIKNLAQIAIEWSAKDLSAKNKAPFFANQKDEEEESPAGEQTNSPKQEEKASKAPFFQSKEKKESSEE